MTATDPKQPLVRAIFKVRKPVSRLYRQAMWQVLRKMQFRIVAELVEHQEDFDWLRDSGVDFVEGHFIEAPEKLGKATTQSTYRILNSERQTRTKAGEN